MRRTPCVQRSQSRERVFVSRASWMRENRSVESIGFCESPGERPRRRTSSFIEGEAPSPRRRALAGRQGRKTAVGMDRWRCEACPTEPRASASGRHPRAKVTSDSLTLAVPCCAGVEFFMGFRGPKGPFKQAGKPVAHCIEKPPCRISDLRRVSRESIPGALETQRQWIGPAAYRIPRLIDRLAGTRQEGKRIEAMRSVDRFGG
jgi:hypothetical protein